MELEKGGMVVWSAAEYVAVVRRLARDEGYNRRVRVEIRRAVRGGGGEEEEEEVDVEKMEGGKQGNEKERNGERKSDSKSRLFRNADVAREWISFILRLFQE
jgi:hypothetical protein